MASSQISAVSIKRLWYSNPIEKAPTTTELMNDVTKVENVHQDTWTLEESEPSQDSYKNQLTGLVYRMGRKEMGEITANFTIGRYDYVLKQAFMGGTVMFDDNTSSDDTDVIAEKVKPIYKIKKADGTFYQESSTDKTYNDFDTAATKAKTLTGSTIVDVAPKAVAWSRARGSVEVRKTLYALTDDNQLCILPYVNLNAHEGDSDGAIGIVIQGMALDPTKSAIMPEYWFDVSDDKTWSISDSGISKK